MFPASKLGAPGECDGGVEKPLFLEPQSLTEPSKKKKRSFYSQTHFHVASTLPSEETGERNPFSDG